MPRATNRLLTHMRAENSNAIGRFQVSAKNNNREVDNAALASDNSTTLSLSTKKIKLAKAIATTQIFSYTYGVDNDTIRTTATDTKVPAMVEEERRKLRYETSANEASENEASVSEASVSESSVSEYKKLKALPDSIEREEEEIKLAKAVATTQIFPYTDGVNNNTMCTTTADTTVLAILKEERGKLSSKTSANESSVSEAGSNESSVSEYDEPKALPDSVEEEEEDTVVSDNYSVGSSSAQSSSSSDNTGHKDNRKRQRQQWVGRTRSGSNKRIKTDDDNDNYKTDTSDDESSAFSIASDHYDEEWNKMFLQLVAFKDEHQTTIIPRRYKRLTSWCHFQRNQYRNVEETGRACISQERIDKLNSIDFIWDTRIGEWNIMYERLLEFKKEYGHTNVSRNIHDDRKLADWVNKQRSHYALKTKGHKNSLTQDRVDILNSVGFVWNTRTNNWNKMYERLAEFKKKNGHINVMWRKDRKLCKWMDFQRETYRKKRRGQKCHLKPDRIQMLNELNFVWDPRGGNSKGKMKIKEANL